MSIGTQAPVYDAAILTLKVPIKFKWEPHVRPVCLPSLHEFRENGTGTVAGWGHIRYEGTFTGEGFLPFIRALLKEDRVTSSITWC